jgi:hypothetical protein
VALSYGDKKRMMDRFGYWRYANLMITVTITINHRVIREYDYARDSDVVKDGENFYYDIHHAGPGIYHLREDGAVALAKKILEQYPDQAAAEKRHE